ncbi:Deoxyguanosinetriphosphate triphosphohydrolase, partial [Dissostichus eleginoides]
NGHQALSVVAYFLWTFAGSTDEVVKQHGGHLEPGWKHAVVSQLHIDREKNRSFYVAAEAGLKRFRSSCLLALDSKTRSPSVVEDYLDFSSGGSPLFGEEIDGETPL